MSGQTSEYLGVHAPALPGPAAPSLRVRARALLPASCPLLDHGPFLVAAIGVGLLTGFFGVGGGFLATALAGHLGTGISFDPSITILFTAGVVLTGLAGGTLSTRLPAASLGRGFAVVVLTLAAYLSLQVV